MPGAGKLQNDVWIKKVASGYTPDQILSWLTKIDFKTSYTTAQISMGDIKTNLDDLSELSRGHLITFPFENLAMHYAEDHTVDVSPGGAYNRLIQDSKGSWCFGLNTVLLGMLRGLGYRAYAGAARVNMNPGFADPPAFEALTHMILFVQPIEGDNTTYLVDTGFGGSGLCKPILLSDSPDNIIMGVTPTELHRLTRGTLPCSSIEPDGTNSSRSDIEWRLEACHVKSEESNNLVWKTLYTFTEREFFDADFQAASFALSDMPRPGLFWDNVICIRHVVLFDADLEAAQKESTHLASDKLVTAFSPPSHEEQQYLARIVMFGNEIKRHVGTRSEVLKIMKAEVDRIDALHGVFGINVGSDAAVHIKGRTPALPGE